MIVKIHNRRLNETSYLTEGEAASKAEQVASKIASKMDPATKMDADAKYKKIYDLVEKGDTEGIVEILKTFDTKSQDSDIDFYSILGTVSKVLVKNGISGMSANICIMKIWTDYVITFWIYRKKYTREEADRAVAKCLTFKSTVEYIVYLLGTLIVSGIIGAFIAAVFVYGGYAVGGSAGITIGAALSYAYIFIRVLIAAYKMNRAPLNGGYLKDSYMRRSYSRNRVSESSYRKNLNGSYTKYGLNGF